MECYSEDRDRGLQDSFRKSTVFQHIAKHCNSILDVGCGSAGICEVFSPTATFCGVDYSPLACQLAEQRHGAFNRRFVQADLHTWSTNETFDLALSLTMLATYRSHGWEDQWPNLFHLMDKAATQVLFFYEELFVINNLLHSPSVHASADKYLWLIAPVHLCGTTDCIAEAYGFKNHDLYHSLFK